MSLNYCPYTNTSPPQCYRLLEKLLRFCDDVMRVYIEDERLKDLIRQLCS